VPPCPAFLATGTVARPWMGLSAEQALADVAASSGDLAELVEEAHSGQVGRSQLAGGGQAAGANCHGVAQQALHQVIGGVLEGGPSAVGEGAKAQANPAGEFVDGQGWRERGHKLACTPSGTGQAANGPPRACRRGR
jgi:hypothetical protein